LLREKLQVSFISRFDRHIGAKFNGQDDVSALTERHQYRGENMKRKSSVIAPNEIADDRKVRIGDGGIYFELPGKKPEKNPPAEVADEGNVRLGDGGIYFAAPGDA
jgi:hypothetical protein